ncbi:unnamed protein product [Rotaria socialis]|uniref:Serine incorporator n=1 Tax=Rotaria socialis TaxID=392032 RepID=A0A820PMS8_9BILA|nr:unnamed protein product [Rotaria socialis]CAF4405665.1 unnamed protein product [Rotaria socialis]
MGLCLGSLGSSAVCCFGNAFCSLCCSACPSCKGSTSTRIAYGLILVAGLIVSCIMLIPGLENTLSKIPALCKLPNANIHLVLSINCSQVVGSLAVYRLSFGMSMFFLILSLLMIKVKTSNDFRAKIQNGFWGFKLIILISLIVGAFFIPNNGFDYVFMIFGLIGGFIFILLQLLISIDFVHSWNQSWVDHVESGSKRHGYGLLFFTFLFYALTITGTVLFYVYYVPDRSLCRLHAFFISFNIFLCFVLSIISILPYVRQYNSSCGLLQSSFVSLYVIYYTWSAMSNNPKELCNPSINSVAHPINPSVTSNPHPTRQQHLLDPITVIGLIIFVCTLFYSIITTSRNNRAKKLFFSSSIDSTILDDAQLVNSVSDHKWMLGSDDHSHQRVYDDERGSVTYNYSLFHFMLVLAVLNVMMTLTNWYDPAKDFSTYNNNLASLWIKIISSWLCVLLYVWTCVAPVLFPDRDFS